MGGDAKNRVAKCYEKKYTKVPKEHAIIRYVFYKPCCCLKLFCVGRQSVHTWLLC